MNRRRKDKSQKNRIKNQTNETQPINNRVFLSSAFGLCEDLLFKIPIIGVSTITISLFSFIYFLVDVKNLLAIFQNSPIIILNFKEIRILGL